MLLLYDTWYLVRLTSFVWQQEGAMLVRRTAERRPRLTGPGGYSARRGIVRGATCNAAPNNGVGVLFPSLLFSFRFDGFVKGKYLLTHLLEPQSPFGYKLHTI